MYTHIYIIYMCNIYIEYVCVYTYRCINPSWSTIPRAVGEPRCPAWKRCAPLPRKRAASKRMAWMGTGFPGFLDVFGRWDVDGSTDVGFTLYICLPSPSHHHLFCRLMALGCPHYWRPNHIFFNGMVDIASPLGMMIYN